MPYCHIHELTIEFTNGIKIPIGNHVICYTFVMHHDPSGPGLALEKSTTPLKSGSSGSWMGENGTSGSGPAAGMG